MRSPAIHRILGVRREPGLVGVLGHECRWEDAVVTDWSDLVHVLPAGQLRVTPHKLVGNGVLRSLIGELREKYRYVIIDTPPILAASEALVLSQVADASLMCAMQDVSRLDQIRKAHERLLAVGSRPVGVVLNGVSARRYSYTYGRYSYSARYGS
jgi:Mrp family chromosome partitioning ATPase